MDIKKIALGGSLVAALMLLAACATVNTWGTTNPPIARLKVFDYTQYTDIDAGVQIDFSINNVTDQDLTNLTLTVTQNPSNGVYLPFTEMTIDRIPAHGTWTPNRPFVVRGRYAGSSVVFLTLTENGKFLAKDYGMVWVAPDNNEHRIFGRDMR